MKSCVVVCGGDFSPSLLPEKGPNQLWIAADSGLEHLRRAGIEPDAAVGDWDSLGWPPEGPETVTLPVRKDDTDLVAALRLGYERGCRDFTILGALGGRRFSHSLAAVQSLYWLKTLGAGGEIVDSRCRVTALAEGEERSFPASARGHLSVMALSQRASVRMRGLWYSGDVELTASFPLGVSNAFTGAESAVACTSGFVALVVEEE